MKEIQKGGGERKEILKRKRIKVEEGCVDGEDGMKG